MDEKLALLQKLIGERRGQGIDVNIIVSPKGLGSGQDDQSLMEPDEGDSEMLNPSGEDSMEEDNEIDKENGETDLAPEPTSEDMMSPQGDETALKGPPSDDSKVDPSVDQEIVQHLGGAPQEREIAAIKQKPRTTIGDKLALMAGKFQKKGKV